MKIEKIGGMKTVTATDFEEWNKAKTEIESNGFTLHEMTDHFAYFSKGTGRGTRYIRIYNKF